jgi:putative CocE/NonD family hydrolase
MRDGTVLRADVYRPAGPGPFPVLVIRTPYSKRGQRADPYVAAGYVVVAQDARGRFTSDGTFESFVRPETHDATDGYDTVEWAAKLPGSSGAVGMIGLSYLGKTQWHAAVMQPPSLRSMAPGQTWGNHLNGAQMRGGARELDASARAASH